MQFSVFKRALEGPEVHLPASKSISNRALIINALCGGGVVPRNLSDCDDTQVMIQALDALKHEGEREESDAKFAESNALLAEGTPQLAENDAHLIINIKAAGTAMRFLTAYLSITEGARVLTGTERMRQRPIQVLVDTLRSLGADIRYTENEGFPPLLIRGRRLVGGEVTLPGNVSSQYVSALLMIAPCLQRGLRLTLSGEIISRPYIDMTLRIMQQFGAEAAWTTEREINVTPGGYRAVDYLIENDWSASSYWYEMVALTPGSEVRLPGLFRESLQGDREVRDIFHRLGVETQFLGDRDGIVLRHTGRHIERLELDMLRQPDLAQTVVVTCCMLNIPFRITGLQSLKIKETDRIHALRTELRKLGYLIDEAEDSILLWNGQRCQAQAQPTIDTYEDHRMAMSFAPCAQVLGEVRINDPQVVSKSYPTFWEEFNVRQN